MSTHQHHENAEHERGKHDHAEHEPVKQVARQERRRTVRYECEGHAEVVRIPSPGMRDSLKIQNLSLGGCLLEMKNPYPPATQLEMLIRIGLLTLRVTGKVRARHKTAVGVEFDQMSSGARLQLRELVSAFEAGAAPRAD